MSRVLHTAKGSHEVRLGASVEEMEGKDPIIAQLLLSMEADTQAIQIAIASGDLTLEQGKADLQGCRTRYRALLAKTLEGEA